MIAAFRRRLATVTGSDRAQDRGISLVELLVAMMVFSILLAMTVGFFVSANTASVTNKQITNTTGSASNGINELTRVIRGAVTNGVANQTAPAPAFATAGSNTMLLYTSINTSSTSASSPEMVQFSVSGTSLIEQTWQPTLTNGYYVFPSTNSTPATTRVVASPIVLPSAGGPNLFTYIDTNNAAITMSNGAVPNVAAIAAVQVNLQVGTANTASQSTLLTNIVGLPNLNVSRTAQ
ncbi:PulJ/GspJ family protein [Frondihabitans australicus]|uniref:Prepilin-type N-terminal cleavage/methylation domain-containing protein n=1 Tax=Frondihabitans australicus TaxID=386892 RepID=A0A495IK71_9MICO|nr:prepilin-type N-terminal cleavage/methylation domain-containing protein [Frondihabitans australicus]RKR75526.1 prepilin-type N-terminal cleavage/methylation domain-containing protein [Frondihabitans australicus]